MTIWIDSLASCCICFSSEAVAPHQKLAGWSQFPYLLRPLLKQWTYQHYHQPCHRFCQTPAPPPLSITPMFLMWLSTIMMTNFFGCNGTVLSLGLLPFLLLFTPLSLISSKIKGTIFFVADKRSQILPQTSSAFGTC